MLYTAFCQQSRDYHEQAYSTYYRSDSLAHTPHLICNQKSISFSIYEKNPRHKRTFHIILIAVIGVLQKYISGRTLEATPVQFASTKTMSIQYPSFHSQLNRNYHMRQKCISAVYHTAGWLWYGIVYRSTIILIGVLGRRE